MHTKCNGVSNELYKILKACSLINLKFLCPTCEPRLSELKPEPAQPTSVSTAPTCVENASLVLMSDHESTPVAVGPLTVSTPGPKKATNNKKTYAQAAASSRMPKDQEQATNHRSSPLMQDILAKVSRLEQLVQEQTVPVQKCEPRSPTSRDNCLIILNAPESTNLTAANRRADDLLFLQRMVTRLFDREEEGICVVTSFRLGRKPDDGTKSRPLKVVLQSADECQRVLRRTYRLKEEQYIVVRDLPPEDRIRMREAVESLKERRQSGETNLHIVDFQVVKKGPRVGWKSVFLIPDEKQHLD